ncbi:MAG: mannonate dehydratase [Tannerella sp.]|jgi:mannonate dehydratase|nr:mannonate dehydratase [Tannerella sp.]
MLLEKTWRWFGANDGVPLEWLRQMGIEGVVTALHAIPTGEVWPVEKIRTVQTAIEHHRLRWRVVESLPVAEGIKTRSKDCSRLVENYRRSLRNLGACGIDTVCYNFMPVLDWARTDLHFKDERGGETMLFDYAVFAAFDIYILRRPNAADDYGEDVCRHARELFEQMTEARREELAHDIIVVTQAFIHGAVSDGNDYKRQFLKYLDTYRDISPEILRDHLAHFLNDVAPVAEEAGIRLCIHADDPPFPLLGLPRIASTLEDFQQIISCCDSPANGVTFCTGSLSGRSDNDPVVMARTLAPRIHFAHLRNTRTLSHRSFCESGHLEGTVDMYAIVRILMEEQMRRQREGRRDARIPFRPDHGLRILDDYVRNANPGYPLYGRLKGLAEIDGMQQAIARMLENKE